MKYFATLVGFLIGLIVFADLPSILVLTGLAFVLFDSKNVAVAKISDTQNEIFLNDNNSGIFLYINNIIQIGVALLKLKNNIVYNEISVLKTFLINDMQLEGKDITEVNNIIHHTVENKNSIEVENAVVLVNQYCRYEEKLNIIHLLFVIAIADSQISSDEFNFILNVAQGLNIKSEHFEQLKNVYCVKEIDAYKILGINTDASVAEIKKKYRKLAMLYHPDKIDGKLSDKEKQQRIDKFQEIVAAYKIAVSEAEKNS